MRAMNESHRGPALRIGNGDGEKQRILVGDIIEVHTLVRHEGRQPHSLPVKQVLRHGQRDAGATWS